MRAIGVAASGLRRVHAPPQNNRRCQGCEGIVVDSRRALVPVHGRKHDSGQHRLWMELSHPSEGKCQKHGALPPAVGLHQSERNSSV